MLDSKYTKCNWRQYADTYPPVNDSAAKPILLGGAVLSHSVQMPYSARSNAVYPARPTHIAHPLERDGSAFYIFGVNMMCAFGVPGNMIHGASFCGLSLNPVVAVVAYGM